MKKAGLLISLLSVMVLILVGCFGGSSGLEHDIQDSYGLTVTVLTEGDATALSGVTISLSGSSIDNGIAGHTDSSGKLSLTQLEGTVVISASHSDYSIQSRTVTANSHNDITIIAVPIISGQEGYEVTFNVNSVTQGLAAISGALVEFADTSGYTDSAGTLTFTGIEEDTYQYTVSADGYTQLTGSVDIEQDQTVQVYMTPVAETGNQVHFSGVLFYDQVQDYWTEIPYEADGHYDQTGQDTDDLVGSGDYHSNSLAFPNAVEYTFDGIAIDEGTRLIIYSEEDFQGEILLDVYGPRVINNVLYQGSAQVADYLTKTFSPEELNDNFPPESRSWSDSDMHSWSYGSCRIRTSSDSDYYDTFTSITAGGTNDVREQNINTDNPAGIN